MEEDIINKKEKKKVNKKKIIIGILIIIIAVFLSGTFILYAKNAKFRNFCDYHVFSKNISKDNLNTINIDDASQLNVFAWNSYICVIKDNYLVEYNSSGKEEMRVQIDISNPLIAINDNFLSIAQNDGQKVYLLSKSGIIWQKDLEGKISRINVNYNGYVSMVLSDTAYKSVIVAYDESGNELLKTYLSTTIAVDSDISQDNKYLAFAQVNMSGTLIESNIKIISIAKAKENPSDSIIYTYNAPSNSLVINIKYQSKSKLICMYDNSIDLIENNNDKQLIDLSDSKNNTFSDIELYTYVAQAVENKDGILDTNTTVKLINGTSQKTNEYNLNGSIKELYCYGDKICINLGSEAHFINTNGWLVKKYTSDQEIRKIVLSNNIAGIVYKDKIEILNL